MLAAAKAGGGDGSAVSNGRGHCGGNIPKGVFPMANCPESPERDIPITGMELETGVGAGGGSGTVGEDCGGVGRCAFACT